MGQHLNSTLEADGATAGVAAGLRPAYWVVAAGIGAALHVGKLPPALPVLEQVLGISLLQAGFLLSLVQLAGMALGLVTGLAVQYFGLRRSMIAGLLVLGSASMLGALAESATWLLLTRGLEGLGFLWAVLPGPGLLRRLVPRERINRMLGIWGTFMPLGTALALLMGPWVMLLGPIDIGWRIWWCLLSAVALAFSLVLIWKVPPDQPAQGHTAPSVRSGSGNLHLLKLTLRSGSAWLLALTFGAYSGQWLAVVGFLPSIYAKAGVSVAATGGLTALAAGLNMVGNVAAGRLLERGIRPVTLLVIGFLAMSSGAMLAFSMQSHWHRQFAAVLGFSMVGGLIPATLFSLAVRLAPAPEAVSATVGWMQQWSSAGQFAVPPFIAWVAVLSGGWRWTGWISFASCAVGLVLAAGIRRKLASPIDARAARPETGPVR
jgi:predicted MFS family arabinose efflux permease